MGRPATAAQAKPGGGVAGVQMQKGLVGRTRVPPTLHALLMPRCPHAALAAACSARRCFCFR